VSGGGARFLSPRGQLGTGRLRLLQGVRRSAQPGLPRGTTLRPPQGPGVQLRQRCGPHPRHLQGWVAHRWWWEKAQKREEGGLGLGWASGFLGSSSGLSEGMCNFRVGMLASDPSGWGFSLIRGAGGGGLGLKPVPLFLKTPKKTEHLHELRLKLGQLRGFVQAVLCVHKLRSGILFSCVFYLGGVSI